MTDEACFRDELVAAGHLILSGTDGIYGRSSAYEDIVAAVDRLAVEEAASEGAVPYRFPPVMPRHVFERTGYLSSFPDLIGSVSTFTGGNADHRKLMDVAQSGGDWTELLEAAGVNLCPAACHPLYPTLAGTLPEGGGRYDVAGWCYRHEPSVHAARMQAFRMHELVYVGDAAGAGEHRDRWLQQGVEILVSLGLEVETVVANDPFFGGSAASWRTTSGRRPSSTRSCRRSTRSTVRMRSRRSNCHLDHFGQPFGIVTADGEVAHSCCFGFGLDRITLALFRAHGMHPADWPAAPRDRLWP